MLQKQPKTLTLGSLFSGSGGFELAGLLSGIVPIWNSEIEPFAIRVTTKRLPFVKHYGDITKLNGGELEPVDIITFGSPCQDMSVAGQRTGLSGSRSNLFFEAIRIIKEMRCKTNGKYPRYIVWENVYGVFSSKNGEDFKTILQEICKIKDESVYVPKPPKWQNAGEILGDGYSVAWRLLDAQFWGVPQRRRRVFLVADFRGGSAGKILFESEGLSGYSKEGFSSWQRATRSVKNSLGATGTGFDGYNGCLTENISSTLGANCGMSTGRNGVVLNDQGGERIDVTDNFTATLRAEAHHPPCVIDKATAYENHSQDTRFTELKNIAPTVTSRYGTGGNNQPFVVETADFRTEHSSKSRSIGFEEECSPTLRADCIPAAIMNEPKMLKIRSGKEGGGKGALIQTNKSATLSCNNDQTLFEPTVYGICAKNSNSMLSNNPHSGFYEANTSRTLDENGGNCCCNRRAMTDSECADCRQIFLSNNEKGRWNTCMVFRGVLKQLGGKRWRQDVHEELVIDCQSGMAIVEGIESAYSLQGNMIGRNDKNGPQGSGINKDISFTLNATDKHAVYAMTTGFFTRIGNEISPTIAARGYKDPNIVAEQAAYGIGRDTFNQGQNAQFKPSITKEVQPTIVAKGPGAVAQPQGDDLLKSHQNCYAVRRLTPKECARLMGFPDWWCSNLETTEPTTEDIKYWSEVFEEYRQAMGKITKPKTEKQISKWLKSPHSDSAEYKLWGNGIVISCVFFVLAGIASYAQLATIPQPLCRSDVND